MREMPAVTEARLTTLADANLLHAAQTWAAASVTSKVEERDGLLMASAGVPMRSFNNVFVRAWGHKAGARLRTIIRHFDELGLPFRVRVLEGREAVAEDTLTAHGLRRAGGIPCLALTPLRESLGDNRGLRLERVADPDSLRHHVAVVAAGFGWPAELLAQVFTHRLIGDGSWRAYVGYLDGRAVAASQLVVTGRVAGIYYVATLEEARRRGFGEAMTRYALNEGAAADCTMASLQASPLGYPIYRRMGFQDVGYYRSYVREEVAHAG